jgi:hypothetical protein
LDAASSPQDVERAFNAVAASWLAPANNSRPNPTDLIRWTGEGWKEALRTRCLEEIEGLNTPNSKNIRELSKRYVGLDVTTSWKWGSVSASRACARLDQLIRRRGELVHCGKQLFEQGNGAKREEAQSALELVQRLVECSCLALAAQEKLPPSDPP